MHQNTTRRKALKLKSNFIALVLVYNPSFTTQKHSSLNLLKDVPLPASLKSR